MARSRLALAAALVTLFLGAANAHAERQLYVETRGGANQAKLAGDVATDSKYGFVIGMAVHVPFSSSFSLQTELNYAAKGASFGEITNPIYDGVPYSGTFDQLYALDYLELPVLARFSLGHGHVRPVLVAGPYLGWKVLEKARLHGSDNNSYAGKPNDFAPLEAGATAGVGLEFGPPERCATLEARYTRGLTDALRGVYRQSANTDEMRVVLGWRIAYPPVLDPH